MRLVDTNYLLRYILRDDEAMYQKACRTIAEGTATRLESIPEVIYVLTGFYGVARKEASSAVAKLLQDVDVPEKETVLDALKLYGESRLDYLDCIYIAVSKRDGERGLHLHSRLETGRRTGADLRQEDQCEDEPHGNTGLESSR